MRYLQFYMSGLYISILNIQFYYKDNKQHRYESERQNLVQTENNTKFNPNLWIVPESKHYERDDLGQMQSTIGFTDLLLNSPANTKFYRYSFGTSGNKLYTWTDKTRFHNYLFVSRMYIKLLIKLMTIIPHVRTKQLETLCKITD